MTQQEASEQEYLIPDEIARAAVLPGSYTDEENTVFPAYAWLRANNPLGLAKLEGFDPIWLVTKHADLMAIERNPELFPAGVNNAILNDQASDNFTRSLTGGTTRIMDAVPFMDPPEHTTYRGVVDRSFLPRAVKKYEPQIRDMAREAVDKVLAIDGEFDFLKDFAFAYPLHVIMTLFGVPAEDEPIMLKLTQEFFGVHDPEVQREAPSPDEAARLWIETSQSFYDYFGAKTAERRAQPTDDLLSQIANAQVDGELIRDSYANGWYVAIATAGHDTTSTSLAAFAYAITRWPEQLTKIKADPALIPKAVEESVRWSSPVKHFMRSASADTELRGRRIRAGDRLMLLYASGSRDEEVFEDPDVFNVERPVKHISFGSGPHTCVGMHVAKLEMGIMLEELLPRINGIELTGKPKYAYTNFVGGLKRLPVRLVKT